MANEWWIARLLGTAIARPLLAMVPHWIEARWYGDDRLASEISLRTTLAFEGATLRRETWHGIPRLTVRLVLENHSLYRDVRVDRKVVSVNGGFDLVYEGWATPNPPSVIQSTTSLTAEQAAWLIGISGVIELKGVAAIVCDRHRRLRRPFYLAEKLSAAP